MNGMDWHRCVIGTICVAVLVAAPRGDQGRIVSTTAIHTVVIVAAIGAGRQAAERNDHEQTLRELTSPELRHLASMRLGPHAARPGSLSLR